MAKSAQIWSGDQWQDRVKLWLSIRYKDDWVSVPDSHGGDFGIEGFSRTGNVYQCYAAEGTLSTSDLYTKQRDKMSEDLGKFCKNYAELVKIFGTTKIKRWILTVPKHQSPKLYQHATSKTAEILQKKLTYVDDDFQVHIQTEDDFVIEESTVLKKGARQINFDLQDVNPQDLKAFKDLPKNNLLIKNLDLKIPKITQSNSQQKKISDAVINSFIRGRNLLEHIRKYPECWERVDKIKREREQLLELPTLASTSTPANIFNDTVKDFSRELREEVSILTPTHADALAQEAVSDWLLRCPLQFPD